MAHQPEPEHHEVKHVHPACPECVYGSIYTTGDNDALICSMCRTVFTQHESD